METPIIKKKKTASQLLKDFGLTVEEAENLFDEIFNICEKNEKDEEQEDVKNANEMEALEI